MKIGIIGCFQNGKSTLINCLLGAKLAQTGGDGITVTSSNVLYKYGGKTKIISIDNTGAKDANMSDFLAGKYKHNSHICIECKSDILENISIIDTPGFNANVTDTETALSSLDNLDIAILVIINKGISTIELDILSELQYRNIPYYILMNCWMQQAESTWNPYSEFNRNILAEVQAKLNNNQLSPMMVCGKQVLPINCSWYWYATNGYMQDEKQKREQLLRLIQRYKEKKPQTNFAAESNIQIVIEFLSSKLNLRPIHLYNTISRNNDKCVNKIIHIPSQYTQYIENETRQELAATIQNRQRKQIKLEDDEIQLKDIMQEEIERGLPFQQPFRRLLYSGFQNVEDFIKEIKKEYEANQEREKQRSLLHTESASLKCEIEAQASYIQLISIMLNHQNK